MVCVCVSARCVCVGGRRIAAATPIQVTLELVAQESLATPRKPNHDNDELAALRCSSTGGSSSAAAARPCPADDRCLVGRIGVTGRIQLNTQRLEACRVALAELIIKAEVQVFEIHDRRAAAINLAGGSPQRQACASCTAAAIRVSQAVWRICSAQRARSQTARFP